MEYTVEEYNKKKELAESGNLDAICDLGYLYYYGFGNTAPDIDKGVYYWRKAADLGNAVAQDAMAWCYEYGVGVEKNLFTAVDLKMKAANGGYSFAQFDVGNYFYYGYSEVNIESNVEIAYSWYKKAADQNNGNAQLMVAYCLENGIGTDTNEDKSIEYYEKSASNGIAEAYLNLANIYSRKKMYDKSLELYKMAVDRKNYLAAVNISDYYCMVEESVDEAIKWINMAIDNNAIDKSTLPQLPCYGATLGTVAIDYKGLIYQCQHLLCHEEYSIGDVFEGVIVTEKVNSWYDGTVSDKCKKCEVLPLCQGGCVTKPQLGKNEYVCHMMKYRIKTQEQLKVQVYMDSLLE